MSTPLIDAVGKLDARYLRDENGREIRGAHWVNRNEVVELLMRAAAPGVEARVEGLTVESATTIAEEIIKEYQKLERGGYTHWHKRSMGRMLKAGVDAALGGGAAASTGKGQSQKI
jgi:hypothetical protein